MEMLGYYLDMKRGVFDSDSTIISLILLEECIQNLFNNDITLEGWKEVLHNTPTGDYKKINFS